MTKASLKTGTSHETTMRSYNQKKTYQAVKTSQKYRSRNSSSQKIFKSLSHQNTLTKTFLARQTTQY